MLLAAMPLALGCGSGVVPPDARFHGRTYGQWAAEWWVWALNTPPDQSPIDDTTGELAAVGQSGPVWFLAGTNGGPVERTCTVPRGKALFFPLVNICDLEFVGDPYAWSAKYALWAISHWVDEAEGLSCTIDGVKVKRLCSYRGAGAVRRIALGDSNLWGLPGGCYGPLAADGYWIMLEPLSRGRHEIRFQARIPEFDWTGVDPDDYYLPQWGVWSEMVQDVTYHLTVLR